METIYFSLPGNENLTRQLAQKANAQVGLADLMCFPDGESYVCVHSDVQNKCAVLVCTLNNPDLKILPIYFLSKTLRSLGAKKIILIAPYLAYMRQDKIFHSGEGLTSSYFANLISELADELITIDPHLHRIGTLSEIYSIPAVTRSASELITNYIKQNIKNPLLIGPDAESEQWVSKIAAEAQASFIVLHKIRYGDRDVEVSMPDAKNYNEFTPVLVDDIISTAKTMIRTIEHLNELKMKAPVCIGIHAIFAGNAYRELQMAGAADIITTTTVPHQSNQIDISNLLQLPA